MPNIVLKEQDLTTVVVASESTDVVFIPGIADTNFNCYICNTPDVEPTNEALTLEPTVFADGDTIHHKANGKYGAPSIFVNTFDKKAWKYTEETTPWVAIEYTAIAPVNQPTYVDSIEGFTTQFGKKAYAWKVANYTNATEFNNARKLPVFKANELPGKADADHYFYNEEDTEKSWLYAKEMIYAGLPIFFEDVATLTNVGTEDIPVYTKELPVLTNFYDALASTLTGKPDEEGYNGTHGVYTNYEIFDLGEYNFKYVTSGVYPTFNCLKEEESEDNAITADAVTAHKIVITLDDKVENVDAITVGSASYEIVDTPVADESCKVEIGGDAGNVVTVTFANGDTNFVTTNTISIDYTTEALITENMMALCTKRGDCYALIDHADNVLRPWYGTKSLFNAVQNAGIGGEGSVATMFTPWGTYAMDTAKLTTLMPASFGYLKTLAYGIRTYNNYLAYAGVNRGEVPGLKELHCMYPLTNTVANDIQVKSGYSINPITFVKPYGYTIWGNRTLLKAEGLKALNFLNIRNLVCEVKKTAYNAAKVCLFENDNLGTWVRFVTPITNLLTSMQDAGALKAYQVSRIPTTEKAVINAEIRIAPTYAVEEFNITVVLYDDGEVTVDTE